MLIHHVLDVDNLSFLDYMINIVDENILFSLFNIMRNNNMSNFDEIIDRTGSGSIKYDSLQERFGRNDLIPLWVADMDFRTPDFIIEALRRKLDSPVLGYTMTSPGYYDAVVDWVRNLHSWNISKEWIRYIPGIVKGIGMVIAAFLKPGDKVIIQSPVYHPFRLVPEGNGYEVVCNPLIPVYADGRGRVEDMMSTDRDRVLVGYDMDFEQLERIIDEHTKLFILSNPHNPAGICWSSDTLRRLAEITSRHGMIVFSDEIHAEMALDGYRHVPYASVSAEAASNAITFMAPSKTFNIAGVVTSYAIVVDDRLRERFYKYLEANELDQSNIFSTVAAEAAYRHGEAWRQEMLGYVTANIDYVLNYLAANIPSIRALRPQASFLVWLDCRSLGLEHDALVDLFVNKARLALNDGAMFGRGGDGFMRLNVGCPRSILEEAMTRLSAALTNLKKQ